MSQSNEPWDRFTSLNQRQGLIRRHRREARIGRALEMLLWGAVVLVAAGLGLMGLLSLLAQP